MLRNLRSTCSATTLPISSEAVAAGDGALQICIPDLLLTIRKSSTKPPSDRRAWARTPGSTGTRSLQQSKVSTFADCAQKGLLPKDLYISSKPDRACLLTSRQNNRSCRRPSEKFSTQSIALSNTAVSCFPPSWPYNLVVPVAVRIRVENNVWLVSRLSLITIIRNSLLKMKPRTTQCLKSEKIGHVRNLRASWR